MKHHDHDLKTAIHLRDKSLYINEGMLFPFCGSTWLPIDLDADRWPVTFRPEEVTCPVCLKMMVLSNTPVLSPPDHNPKPGDYWENGDYNSPLEVMKWAVNALIDPRADITPDQFRIALHLAHRAVKKGQWRGDISDLWREQIGLDGSNIPDLY